MGFGKFESAEVKPLGEGKQKKVFVDSENEKSVISETRQEAEKDTPCQLEGRYLLTKIAHLLLPENIPDIYQAKESADKKQTVEVERISHTPKHVLLQETRQSGKDEKLASKELMEELGSGPMDTTLKIADVGLGFNVDENIGNFTKDELGNVYYLETFKPWDVNPADPTQLEILFDETMLWQAIECISDPKTKEECSQHLDKLLILLDEERKGRKEQYKESLTECAPYIEKLETIFAQLMNEEILTALNSIETYEEAMDSEERRSAKKALISILNTLKILKNETNISTEKYDKLYEKFRTLHHAVGMINDGIVRHK